MAFYSEVQPGTVTLPLKLGTNAKHIEYRTHIVEGTVKETGFDYLRMAAFNTLGAFKYHQHKFLNAAEYFKKVLKEDPQNLNALANLCSISIRMPIGLEGRDYDEQLGQMKFGTKIQVARREARCLAEQAFALRGIGASCFTETEGFIQSNILYGKALSLVTDIPFEREFGGWMLFMITNLRNICRNLDRLERCEHIRCYYEEAFDHTCKLYMEVKGDEDFSLLQGHALVHLGYFACKRFRHIDTSDWDTKEIFIKKYSQLKQELEHPEQCFEMALKLAPKSTKVLNMTARSMHTYLERDHKRCLELLKKSMQIDSSRVNWFARYERADLNKRLHQQQKSSDATPDRDLLLNALADYLWVIEVTPSPYYTCELAKVYLELAQSYRDTDESKAYGYSLKSLECFQQALYTQGGGQLPHIHYYHGLCLKAFGKLRYAIEAFKRSVESHSINSKSTVCFEQLLDSLCKEYVKHLDEVDKAYPVLSEMTFWVIFAFERYDKAKMVLALEECAAKEAQAFTDLSINIAVAEKQFAVGEVCSAVCSKLESSKTGVYYAERIREICSFMKDSQQIVLSTRSPIPRNKTGYKYDVFVIYSDNDKAWALYSLLLKLEQEFSFKGFVSDRDFVPGKTEVCNFEFALENSYKIMLILSPEFLEDSWCKYALETTLTVMIDKKQTDRIVPVKLKECQIPEMLKCIRPFIAMETIHWEKLVEAIE